MSLYRKSSRTIRTTQDLLAGPDNILFDLRSFHLSDNDIHLICRFFLIGEPQYFEKEKNIHISHSSFFVFIKTTSGEYALKFYPKNYAEKIIHEYSLTHLLRRFSDLSIPTMYTGKNKKPFYIFRDHIVVAYSYIKGEQAWQHISQKTVFTKLNAMILSLNSLLIKLRGKIVAPKNTHLTARIKTLLKISQSLSFNQKSFITSLLKKLQQDYQIYAPCFHRRLIHNNLTLSNTLIADNTIYLLDLSHICEDYILSDLSSLICSCLFLDIPPKTIQNIIKNYLSNDIIKSSNVILMLLIQIVLIENYLLCLSRIKTTDFSPYPPALVQNYRFHLSNRMHQILQILQPKIFETLIIV